VNREPGPAAPPRDAAPGAGLRRAVAVFALVLGVRLALGFGVLPRSLPENPRDGYVLLAETLASEGRLAFGADAAPTLFRAPAYPAALAAGYLALGDMPASVLIVNALSGALGAALVDRAATLVALRAVPVAWTLVLALFPHAVYYGASGFVDTFYAMTVALALLSALGVLERGDLRSGLWWGAACALSVLTRPVLLPFPALLLAYAGLRRRRALRAAVVGALVAGALVLPWTLRNRRVSGAFVPVTTGAGFTTLTGFFMPHGTQGARLIRQGQRAAVREALGLEGAEAERELRRLHSPSGYWDIRPEADAVYGRAAWELTWRRPALLLRKLALNLLRFFYLASDTRTSVASGILNLALLGLALPALRGAGARARLEAFLLFNACFVLAYVLVLVAAPRYSLPVQMALAPFAALTLADAWQSWRRTRARSA
jgi:4-amino-4-deoxy-L-arabinose transferase-like glycosyltransferase